MTKVIVTLPDDGLSVSKRDYAGARSWIKLLVRVDTSLSDGHAFEGNWAKFGAAVEVEPGTFFLAYVEDRASGSGRIRSKDVTLYRVTATEGLVVADHWQIPGPGYGWALFCRDDIAGHLAATAEPDLAALRAEKAELLRRAAEIDAILEKFCPECWEPEPAHRADCSTVTGDRSGAGRAELAEWMDRARRRALPPGLPRQEVPGEGPARRD